MPEEVPGVGGEPTARVRPYIHTGGRTEPDRELRAETLLSVPAGATGPQGFASTSHRSLYRLCAGTTEPLALAEIAAHLQLPLGVARVLASDLVGQGLLAAHRRASDSGDRPSQQLLHRVLDGLHRL